MKTISTTISSTKTLSTKRIPTKTISTTISATKRISTKTTLSKRISDEDNFVEDNFDEDHLVKVNSDEDHVNEMNSEEDHFDEENFWQRPFRQFNLSKILLFETEASCSEAPVWTWPKPGPKSNLQVCCKIYCRSPFMLTPKPKRSIRNIINVLFCLPPSYDEAWFRDNMQDKN